MSVRVNAGALLASILALASCATPDERNEPSLELQLIHAIWTGREEVVEDVLLRGADPNVTLDDAYGVRSDPWGKGELTPLFLAVESCATERIFKALLASGANPNRVDSRGETPLFLVVESCSSERILRALLASGADPDWVDSHGCTPLGRVIGDPKYESIALALVAPMKNVQGQVLVRGAVNDFWIHRTSYLHAAVDTPRVLTALLDKGANPIARDEIGDTPLHAAVRAKEYRVVKLLLEKGADPNAEDERGRTPLYWTTNASFVDRMLKQETSPELKAALAKTVDEPGDERDVEIQCLLRSSGAKK